MFKKDAFKTIIKGFWEGDLPNVYNRDLSIPSFPKKVVVVWGPRRCGKSFLLFNKINELFSTGVAKEQVVYINFEDDRLPILDVSDLNDLLEAYFELIAPNGHSHKFFFLDEIQNITGWEKFVRRLQEQEGITVFVTGSSSKLLSREIATALRGRCLSYSLHPLSFSEFLRFKNVILEKNFEYSKQKFLVKRLFEEYLFWGRFPEVVLEEDFNLKRKILQEYFKTIVYQDLAERYTLENTMFLNELLKHLITNSSHLFSSNAYFRFASKNIPVSKNTVFNYLNRVEESGYLSLIPIFSYSLKTQKVNPRKILILDNGLREVAGFSFSKDEGKMAENLVGNMLREGENKELYYWKNKHEVDFVIKEKEVITAVNVCYSNLISERETKSLLEFKERFPRVKKLLILSRDLETIIQGIEIRPLWKYYTSQN